jgi:hypothetical protein
MSPNFYCEKCDYTCSKKGDYMKHCNTIKHNTDADTDAICRKPMMHMCICGNSYKHRQSLHTHRKVCDYIKAPFSESISTNNTQNSQIVELPLVLEILKQNQEFKDLMIEQTKQLAEQQQQNQILLEQQQQQNQILLEQQQQQQQQQNKLLEAVKDGKLGNTINNTTNNNKFNLNIFLNETCKDAITMNEFINSFEVTREDFIRTGNVGFVEGISKVMMKRIQNMELHTRPLHCTDLKRETVYIKNDDKWEKDDSDKTQLRKAVKVVAHRNMNELKRWFHDSKPAVEVLGTDECENYFKYYKAALGGYDKEEDKVFEEKIIKNVLKEVVIDKMMHST